jgi:hypothetical protein
MRRSHYFLLEAAGHRVFERACQWAGVLAATILTAVGLS